MKSDQSSKVTLEDLLRLKRAERPSAEFWPHFERELRAKQLAVIVGRQPWWRTLPKRVFLSIARYHLPVGAAAVLALTLVTVREYQTGAPRGITSTNFGDPAPIEAWPSAVIDGANLESLAMVPDKMATVVVAPAAAVAGATTTNVEGLIALGGTASAMSILVGVAEDDQPTPSTQGPNLKNFVPSRTTDTTFNASLLGGRQNFESRVLPARVVDPLAQMTPPSEVRRSRYLGTSLPVSANASAPLGRSSERLASRLSDDRLYESVSRIGFGGDRVSLMVKF